MACTFPEAAKPFCVFPLIYDSVSAWETNFCVGRGPLSAAL